MVSILAGVVAVGWACEASAQERGDVITAASGHVRDVFLAQMVSELPDSAAAVEGHLLLEPRGFPVPEALGSVPEVIGNTTLVEREGVEEGCRTGFREACPIAPPPVGFVEFQWLKVEEETAEVHLLMYVFPPPEGPLRLDVRGFHVFLTRTGPDWRVTDYRLTVES